jgi:phosphatidylserine/phosphatidylglycerophosphate/cardiolipin synthase-like enzyme
MNLNEIDEFLRQSISDRRFTGSEKNAFAEWLAKVAPDSQKLGVIRSRVFAIAEATIADPDGKAIVEWLEAVTKMLVVDKPGQSAPPPEESVACFSPGDDCLNAVIGEFRRAKITCDVCVFTITDDRITTAIEQAHKRGPRVRIISDNDKAADLGADIQRLIDAGIELRLDRTAFHMHHKFAIFDGVRLLNGSFNWTRSATENNEENLIITTDHALVRTFRDLFESLWKQLK